MNSIIRTWALAFALMSSLAALAQSPVGRRLTFDEANGDTLAIVKVFETENGLAGEIAKLFLRPHAGENGVGARCPEEWRKPAGAKSRNSPQGLWRIFSEDHGKLSSIVHA